MKFSNQLYTTSSNKKGPTQIKIETHQLVMLMPRNPRVSVIGVPQHVIQWGNNRQVIFTGDGDMKAYDSFYLNDFFEEVEALTGKRLKEGVGQSDGKKKVNLINLDLSLFILTLFI